MSNIYEALENESIEYSIYTLDKVIQKHNKINSLLNSEAQIANNELIKQHEAKRASLLKQLRFEDIDWDKIAVIHSIESESNIHFWEDSFKLSMILA